MSETEPTLQAVLDAVTALHDRLDRLEQRVEGLSGGAVAAGGPSTPAVDAALARPEVEQRLARVLDRLDTVEGALAVAERVATHVPLLVDGAAATVGQALDDLEQRGIDPFERTFVGLELLEKASRPEVLGVLGELLDDPELLRFAARAGQQLRDGLVAEGVDLDATIGQGTKVAAKLASALERPELQQLLDSGVLEAAGLALAGSGARALVETRQLPARQIGLFGLLGVIGDPDVQRFVGFGANFAKAFGRALA